MKMLNFGLSFAETFFPDSYPILLKHIQHPGPTTGWTILPLFSGPPLLLLLIILLLLNC